jgi:hypothetical protein
MGEGSLGMHMDRVGQNHIYTVYVRYFWQENHKYTVIYGVYIRFWPTLHMVLFAFALNVPFSEWAGAS